MKLKVNNNKQFRKLPYGVVDLAIKEGWVKSLAYFLHITSLYGNAVIYNYSSRTLANKLGVSKSTVHKNVTKLLSLGLMSIDSKGNLVGLSKSDLRLWYTTNTDNEIGSGLLTIKIHNNIKHTVYNIYARTPINSYRQQIHSSKKRAEVNAIGTRIANGKFITSKEYNKFKEQKHILERKQTENAQGFSGDTCYLSDKTLSKATGLSVGTVRSMIKFWKSEGLLDFTFVKGQVLDVRVDARSFEALQAERPKEFSSTYLYKGRVVQFNKRVINLGTSISLR